MTAEDPCPSVEEFQVLFELSTGRERLVRHAGRCEPCRQLLALLTGGSFAERHAVRTNDAALRAPEPPQVTAVTAQLDEFRLVRRLGQGAMGQVYLGHDVMLDRPVAIKWLIDPSPGEDAQARFLVEARAIARLKHPNVVAIYRVGQIDTRRYLVSEFIQGTSLDKLAWPLPWQQVLAIAQGLVRGLRAAHHHGVLHRDIKPANVMISEAGEVKLLDFGLAKLLDSQPRAVVPPGAEEPGPRSPDLEPAAGVTCGALGTPLYMAPELWCGAPATCSSDIYSLGVLLYQLSSGAAPHAGATLKGLGRQVVEQDAPALALVAPQIDPRFASIVDGCLRRSPEERFASVDEIQRALEHLPVIGGQMLAADGSPYRGLSPFEAEHRSLFFGRAQEIQAVLDLLKVERRVVVAGDSGVGKSSLCRAGVLPLCAAGGLGRGRTWALATLLPGHRPLTALAELLASHLPAEQVDASAPKEEQVRALGDALRRSLGAGRGLLLLVDQLEELLTQSEPGEAAAAAQALAALSARGSAVRLLMTVRGDFLTRVANLPGLALDLPHELYLLRPLCGEALREIIVGPALQRGVAFESEALVEELVASTAHAEGGLPLLQFALAELWSARDQARRVIPAAALRQLGGVAGALERHADGVLRRLSPAARRSAQRILQRLVHADGTCARQTESALLSGVAADRAALQALVDGRLLVALDDDAGGAAYKIAHEALVRGWQTLRGWLDSSLEARALRQRVASATSEWEGLGHGAEALWSRRQFQTIEIFSSGALALAPRERAFLSASRRHARGRSLARAALLLGVALVLAVAAAQRYRGAQEQRRVQELAESERGARAASLARQAGMELDALLVGVRALAPALRVGRSPTPLASSGLAAAIAAGARSRPLQGHARGLWMGAFSPDGQRVVTVSEDHSARLWDARSGALLATLLGHEHIVGSAAFSPDGRRLLTTSFDRTARLWDGQSGALLAVLRGHSDGIHDACFSPDGRRLVTASLDSTARLWDLALTPGDPGAVRLRATLRGHTSHLLTCAFSPDSARVLTGSGDHSARVWDAASGAPLLTLGGHGGAVRAVFSPEGSRIATASNDGTARLWEASSGRLLATLRGHAGPVRRVAFSPDGLLLATASNDTTARLWSATTGQVQRTIQGHTAQVYAAAFSADSARLVTASQDGSARVWDVRTGQSLRVLSGHRAAVFLAVFSPRGDQILTTSQDRSARLWDGHTEQRLTLLRAHQAPVWHVGFSPDGQRLLTASQDTTARLWDGRSGAHLSTLQGHTDLLGSAAFSPDGEHIVTAGYDRTARVWSGRTGRHLLTLKGHEHEVWHALFSPSGAVIATAGKDRSARLWDARSGAVIAVLRGHDDTVRRLAFAPDGARLITASHDGTARLWDAHAGQPIAVLRGHTGWVREVAFSADGARVLSASYDGTARVWDGRTGRPLLVLQGHVGALEAAALAPDDGRIVTTGHDGTARLWAASTGQPLAVLRGGSGALRTVAFSQDGTRVAAGGIDNRAWLWDARSGALLATLGGHADAIWHLAFSPDGGRLVTGSDDNSARLWDARTGRALPLEGDPLDARQPDEAAPASAAPLELLASACALLRHQPQAAQVRSECQRFD